MAFLSASAPRLEQCIFCGGSPPSSFATASFDMLMASSSVLPFTISVIMLLTAIAAPQPKVLNFASTIRSFSTLMNNCMASPHVGLPSMPTPSASGISPTFLGFMKWSITFSEYILLSSCVTCFALAFLSPSFSKGRHLSKSFNYSRELIKKIIHILFQIAFADSKDNRPLGQRGRYADRHQYRGRFQCLRRAGRSTSRVDSLHREQQQHCLSFYKLDHETCMVGQPVYGMPGQINFGYLRNSLNQLVSQFKAMFYPGSHLISRDGGRLAHARDSRYIFSPRPSAAFLYASV